MKELNQANMEGDLNNVRDIYYQVKNDHYGRIGHRIIAVSNHILIFGGLNAQNQYNSTTMKLDCETMTVELVPTKTPLRLQGFSLFSYNNQIFLWGGSGPYPQNPKLSICNNSMLKFTGDSFVLVQQKGNLPSARQYQASCFLKGNYLIIMGGNNGKEFFNDWHLLDCSNMHWTKMKVNIDLPPYLNSLVFWQGGRGLLVTGQTFDKQAKQLRPENKVYSFRFVGLQYKEMQLQVLSVGENFKQRNPRGSPVGVMAGLQSVYIILVGGQIYKEGVVVTFCDTLDCFNVETLEWHSIELVPQAVMGFEVAYVNQKIYLVGGISNNKELNQYAEFIDLKVDYIEAKVCKVCRQLYALRELPNDKNINIKFEMQITSRAFFNNQVISKMASYLKYPFSALGLLIDNSLNLSASNIEISFGLVETSRTSSQLVQASKPVWASKKGQNTLAYNYIVIMDNSFGFSQNQILECLCSFSVKTEKYTSDKRYEEEIEIRKQYGINLKLGTLRLGKSCLYITKTEDNSRLFAYFSTSEENNQQQEFTICSYFLYSDGSCSSQVNRRILYNKVKQKLPEDYESTKTTTVIYVFDLHPNQLILTEEQGNLKVCYQQSRDMIFRYLSDYLQSLYLQPFTGRRMSINKREIKCRNYLQIFRRDQSAGKIVKVWDEPPKEIIHIFTIYRVVDEGYFLRNILFYHKNRLIFVMNWQEKFCGVVEISQKINVDICKTKIESKSEQLIFMKGIKSFLSRLEDKRYPDPAKQWLPHPTKSKDLSKTLNLSNPRQLQLSRIKPTNDPNTPFDDPKEK